MNLGQIRNYVDYICNKEQTGQTLTVEQINTVYPVVNNKLLDYYLGPKKKQIGQPDVVYEESQFNTEALRPFKKTIDYVSIVGGIMQYPADYLYPSGFLTYSFENNGCTSTVNANALEIVTDDQFRLRQNHSIIMPTTKDPIVCLKADHLKILPLSITGATFEYIKKQIDPVFDYHFNAQEQEVYLPAGTSYQLKTGEIGSAGQIAGATVISKSVELEWLDMSTLMFIKILLKEIGVNLSDSRLMQYSTQQIQQGV